MTQNSANIVKVGHGNRLVVRIVNGKWHFSWLERKLMEEGCWRSLRGTGPASADQQSRRRSPVVSPTWCSGGFEHQAKVVGGIGGRAVALDCRGSAFDSSRGTAEAVIGGVRTSRDVCQRSSTRALVVQLAQFGLQLFLGHGGGMGWSQLLDLLERRQVARILGDAGGVAMHLNKN
ncbi:hypothetical protein KCU81_g704, partial [Aureobasidium melanogenum]